MPPPAVAEAAAAAQAAGTLGDFDLLPEIVEVFGFGDKSDLNVLDSVLPLPPMFTAPPFAYAFGPPEEAAAIPAAIAALLAALVPALLG